MSKNIVIVVSAMNMGGAQRVVSNLCNFWAENGNTVTLIATFTRAKVNHFELNKGVVLKYVTNTPLFNTNKPLNTLWKLIDLRRLIKEQQPDVVISFLTRVNVATTLAMIGLKCPLIISERTWPPFASLSNLYLQIYKVLCSRVDRIIVQTSKSKKWLLQRSIASDVRVIPNPVVFPVPINSKREVMPNSIISEDRKVILASGRLHKFKQFDILIRAFLQIKEKYHDWDLIILGDGEESDTLVRLVAVSGLGDRVFFPGRIGNTGDWYERADMFVLSSVVEGFPNVLLEALAYGLPCISFDCDTGPRDIIQNGVNGILVNPIEREIGLSTAMSKIISNQELRDLLSNNAVEVREKYSLIRIMKEWDKILEI